MSTYIALLRGVNVGGNNKVPMALLRTALEADGFDHVRSYIQSGNILVDATRTNAAKVGARVAHVVSTEFDVAVPVIVVDVPGLSHVVKANPYSHEADHKKVHAIFLPTKPDATSKARLDELSEQFSAKGDQDSMTLIGTTLYLHTPGGFGTSDLAKALTSKGRLSQLNGTARNWATVTTLLAMGRT